MHRKQRTTICMQPGLSDMARGAGLNVSALTERAIWKELKKINAGGSRQANTPTAAPGIQGAS